LEVEVETYKRVLQLGARGLSVTALVILVLVEIWLILTPGERWISEFHKVTIFTQGTGTVGPSTPTVEPEDFLPLAWIVLIVGLGLAGMRATWRSRPLWVLAIGFALAVIAFLSAWTILGFLYAPAALLLLLAALALALSGKTVTGRARNQAH
jgi:hypothetical protein